MLEIRKAIRRALPLQIAFFGPEGSGKTMSALLLAAGLTPDGKVAVIDTEHGRASLYADNKRIDQALPQGFDVLELDQPYSPRRFIEAIDLVESSGYQVCIIDSSSDSWNGPGGCEDIAEENKGMWNKAKRENKRLMSRLKLSNMHTICCLKAQEKTRVVEVPDPKTGRMKKEFISLGVMPICEKNFFYPMLLGFSVDPITHLSTITKYHEDLYPLFKEPKHITKDDGAAIREWNESGNAVDEYEQVAKRAKAAAADGTVAYREFFEALSNKAKMYVRKNGHEENKLDAENADKATAERESRGEEV